MSVSVKGDFKLLEQMQRQMEELSDRPRLGLSKVMAEKTVDLIREGFEKEEDPYGEPWAPLKRQRSRKRRTDLSDKILQDWGRLRNSLARDKPKITKSGYIVGTNVEYAPHHQFGTRGLTKAYTRVQAVTDPSRHKPLPEDATAREKALHRLPKFMKHSKAAKQKRGVVYFRVLRFKEGGGKIPARPFMPTKGLPPKWNKALTESATKFLDKRLPKA